MANAVTAGQATSNLQTYANQLYESLSAQIPSIDYTPRTEAQLRDNLMKSYQASFDQSVANRRQSTRQNRGAIDADAASRGMGASTWVTDAKLRQNDSEARDLNTLRINRDSTIAQQLATALANQEDNQLAVKQYNAGVKATALNNALSTAGSMYDKFKAEDPAYAVAAGGGGWGGYGGYGGGGGGSEGTPTASPTNPKYGSGIGTVTYQNHYSPSTGAVTVSANRNASTYVPRTYTPAGVNPSASNRRISGATR